jgi:hypothetical protein
MPKFNCLSDQHSASLRNPNMAPTDPHQGGDIFDMAKDGTSIPNDAGKTNTIPSKSRPGDEAVVGVTNPTDIPRSSQDQGAGGGVQTRTGTHLCAEFLTSKRPQIS